MWYLVQVLFVVSALIGAAVISMGLWVIVVELIRAGKQARRLAVIHARANGRRTATRAEWWHYFKDDIAASYSEIYIGPFRLSRDPNKKIKRAYRFSGGRYTD